MLKNVLKKAANFLYNHSAYVKKAVDEHQGRQAALARTEDFEVDEVQITNWILDEAAKAQQRVHGFDIMIGTYADLQKNLPRTRELTEDKLLKKVGPLSHIGFVRDGVSKLADASAVSTVDAMLGQTNWVEKGDTIDCVIIYPEQLRANWWCIAVHGEGIEDITRQIVRHEFRHAEQIKALRKVGGEELVNKVIEMDLTRSYHDRVTEMDAWNEQHLPSYRPIDEFVQEALAAVAAH